jgi:hypothetical protein
MAFKVDTLLAGFSLIRDQLLKTAAQELEMAESYQTTIDQLSAAKRGALAEAGRARGAAEKIAALIS